MANKIGPGHGIPLIKRTESTSDETPPWSGITFTLPVDSDRLSEDLKRRYPHCSTLRERKHMAAIEFLRAELGLMQSKATTPTVKEDYSLATPEATNLQSDSFNGRSRRGSTSSYQSTSSKTPTESLMTRELQQGESKLVSSVATTLVPLTTDSAQQFVFSVVDGRPMKPKTKRRMTREEKVDYTTTRKHGACPTCRRQKGKCTHAGKPSSPNGTSKTQKKALLIDQSMCQRRASKIAARKDPEVLRAYTDSFPNLDQDPQTTSNVTPIFTEPHSQPQNALEDLPRGEELDKGLPGDLSRYVQQQNSLESHGRSMPYEPSTSWPDYSISTGLEEPFNPGYLHYQASGEPEVSIPASSEANLSPMDLSYSTFPSYLQGPWMDNQEYGSRYMEPG